MTPNQLKLIGGGIAALLLGLLVASWIHRGQVIEELTGWQDTVIIATTDATVEPDSKGKRKLLLASQVAPAISGLKRSLDNATATLESMSAAAIVQKTMSDNLDRQLKSTLEGQVIMFKQQAQTIKALNARISSGDAKVDCEMLIEGDSKSAWEGWKQ